MHQNLKPENAGYFDYHHLGVTTLQATALDLQSEDYECKTHKPLVENPCCYPPIDVLSILLQRSHSKWSHQY